MKTTEFDILFRNVFDTDSHFNTLAGVKIPHPVDIYEDANGLIFEIACTGLTKEDINISIEQDILRVSYNKPKEEQSDRNYQTRGIARRSFDLAYKIASKFNLSKADASMKDGLLIITMLLAEEAKPKKLTIK
jgi:HSP20 family molecular chaperone IbpA